MVLWGKRTIMGTSGNRRGGRGRSKKNKTQPGVFKYKMNLKKSPLTCLTSDSEHPSKTQKCKASGLNMVKIGTSPKGGSKKKTLTVLRGREG